MQPRRRFALAAIVLSVCSSVNSFDKVEIKIAQADQAKLDANPWHAADVPGTFVYNDTGTWKSPTTLTGINYRGSYRQLWLVQSGPYRYWKVKFDNSKPFLRMREWNFDKDDDMMGQALRYATALSLFAASGAPCVTARMVDMYVNGQSHGVYYSYPDVDNKEFLESAYGTDAGDLYKIGTDNPNEPCYFGETTWLDPSTPNFLLHYRKQTNTNAVPVDVSSIRSLLTLLNDKKMAPEQFADSVYRHIDIKNYIKCLVVTNFIGHWDGFPQRGKNYWLYYDPRCGRWSYHPWDLHAAFESLMHTLNSMGTNCDIINVQYPQNQSACETRNDRPLYHRLMAIPKFKNAYIQEYRRAVGSGGYLSEQAVSATLNAIRQTVPNYSGNTSAITSFTSARLSSVNQQLGKYPADNTNYFPDPLPALKITEIMYHPQGTATTGDSLYEFIEVKNTGATALNVGGCLLGGGVSYVFPAGASIPAGGYYVIASSTAYFAQRYGRSPDGAFSRRLDNNGETIMIQDPTGLLVTKVRYETKAPWPTSADGPGYSLVPVESNPTGDVSAPSKWKASKGIGGSPFSDDATSSVNLGLRGSRAGGGYVHMERCGAAYRFTFASETEGSVSLDLYDSRGRVLTNVYEGHAGATARTVSIRASQLPIGVAVGRLTTPGGVTAGAEVTVMR